MPRSMRTTAFNFFKCSVFNIKICNTSMAFYRKRHEKFHILILLGLIEYFRHFFVVSRPPGGGAWSEFRMPLTPAHNFFKYLNLIFNIENLQLKLIPSAFSLSFHLISALVISCDLLRLTTAAAAADIVMTMTSEFHSNLDTTDVPINDMSLMKIVRKKKLFITFRSLTLRLLNA